jgi:hypothetical protein
MKSLKEFADHILAFQDVDDVLSGKREEWLDLEKEDWKQVEQLVDKHYIEVDDYDRRALLGVISHGNAAMEAHWDRLQDLVQRVVEAV